MVQVVEEPILPGVIYDLLAKNRAGSVLLHYAVVKETPHNQAAGTYQNGISHLKKMTTFCKTEIGAT